MKRLRLVHVDAFNGGEIGASITKRLRLNGQREGEISNGECSQVLIAPVDVIRSTRRLSVE